MDRIVAVIPARRDVAEAFGAEVIMTSAAHERATDRVSMRHTLRLTLRNVRYISRVYKIGRRMHLQHETLNVIAGIRR
jgi:hypothetical protein